MADRADRMDAFLQTGLDGYIDETKLLCAQPSISATGQGVLECAELVAAVLRRHGLAVRQFQTAGNPVIVGRSEGRCGRTLLFYNHYDVQPPEPCDLWTTPPFEPTIRAGALYARGAKDDKGELVARLAAVDAVRAAGDGTLPCGVTFVVEGGEETGSPHIAQFVREHTDLLKTHGAIWEGGGVDPEGRPGTVLGCRGVLCVELAVETMTRDAHSGSAHYLPNAAWRLLRALMVIKGPDERIAIPGFYDHARPPTESDAELLAALPDYEAWARETFGVREFAGGLRGKAINHAVFASTCNIGGLAAGYQGDGSKTVIPARAAAKLDFRLVPDQDPDDVFAKLRAHLDREGFQDVTVARQGAIWPYRTSAGDPLVALTARMGEAVYQLPYRLEPLAGASSPAYAFADPLGIPVVTAGIGYPGCCAHGPDEHVRLTDFLQGTRHIARILDGFAEL